MGRDVQTRGSGGQDAVAADRTTDGSAAVPLRVQLAPCAPIDAGRLTDLLREAGFAPLICVAPAGAAELEWDVAFSAGRAMDAAATPSNLIALPLAEPQPHAAHEIASREARPAAGGELPSPPLESGNHRGLRARAPGAAPQSDAGVFRPPRTLPVAPRRHRSRRSTPTNPAHDELSAVYAALSCGAALLDETGRTRLANAALLEMLGVPEGRPELLAETLAGLRVYDEFGALLPREHWATQRALRSGRPVQGMVVAIERRDGVRRWLTIDAVPLVDRGGRPRQVAVT